ncbi:MAG: acetylxylan esterase [Magnetococcales bacterium]|nr:acetylxylan esterase [Magnetococcales bacterium]
MIPSPAPPRDRQTPAVTPSSAPLSSQQVSVSLSPVALQDSAPIWREGFFSLRKILYILRQRPLVAARLLRLRQKLTPILGPWPSPQRPGATPPVGTLSPSADHFAAYAQAALRLSWSRFCASDKTDDQAEASTHTPADTNGNSASRGSTRSEIDGKSVSQVTIQNAMDGGTASRIDPSDVTNEKNDPREWQRRAREKLSLLMGFHDNTNLPELEHSWRDMLPNGLLREACYLHLSPVRRVVASLVLDPTRQSAIAAPVMLCLQGHTSGAHISWGEARETIDPARLARGGDFAVQAVARGFVAVCIEQSGFGERREQEVTHQWDHPCIDQVNRALLLGRTLLAERVMDIQAVINWLVHAAPHLQIDPHRIHAMGNSGGGDTALYAAALDERIAGVIAGSCVGRFRTTSGRRKTCPDTVIPGILEWLEYDDILALLAPRPLVAVSGHKDHIYPFAEVAAAVAGAQPVYARLGRPEHIRAVAGPAGHRFYPDVAWPAFMELI